MKQQVSNNATNHNVNELADVKEDGTIYAGHLDVNDWLEIDYKRSGCSTLNKAEEDKIYKENLVCARSDFISAIVSSPEILRKLASWYNSRNLREMQRTFANDLNEATRKEMVERCSELADQLEVDPLSENENTDRQKTDLCKRYLDFPVRKKYMKVLSQWASDNGSSNAFLAMWDAYHLYTDGANKLLTANILATLKTAKKYESNQFSAADLVGEVMTTFVDAVDRWSPEIGRFSSYRAMGTHKIIISALVKKDNAVPISHEANSRRILLLEKCEKQKSDDRIDILSDEERLFLERCKNTVPLDDVINSADFVDLQRAFPNYRDKSSEDLVYLAEVKKEVAEYSKRLNGREHYILAHRLLGDEHSLKDVANHFDISSERVRQLEEKLITRTHKWFKFRGVIDGNNKLVSKPHKPKVKKQAGNGQIATP